MVKWETMWEGPDSQDVGLEAADISNDKAGEKPARRKTKGSCPTLIGAG